MRTCHVFSSYVKTALGVMEQSLRCRGFFLSIKYLCLRIFEIPKIPPYLSVFIYLFFVMFGSFSLHKFKVKENVPTNGLY